MVVFTENYLNLFCDVAVMSSQDSINTVYKCMTRGVSDYLVKPIRKNELRNLWQHVWRRQSVCLLNLLRYLSSCSVSNSYLNLSV